MLFSLVVCWLGLFAGVHVYLCVQLNSCCLVAGVGLNVEMLRGVGRYGGCGVQMGVVLGAKVRDSKRV